MLFKKSLLSLALVATMVFAPTAVASASTYENINTPAAAVQEIQEEIFTVQDGIVDNLNARSNYLIINDETIYTSEKSWDQPSGYASYRIYATNTRNEVMKLTVKYGTSSYSYEIKANSDITITVNNAQAVKHYIAFSTSSGAVAGKVSVRVSDTSL